MDLALNHPAPERRPADKDYHPTTVRWVKEWVPQDVVATGGKCFLLKWVTEDMLKAIKEKSKETEEEELKPEPATEVLFLCSYEGCGKTFIDAGALKKHAHIHGEKQHICQYEGCGKKFLDSSKLKRHYLIHTGERDFICPHEGCGPRIRDNDWKYVVEMAIKLFNSFQGRKGRKQVQWEVIKEARALLGRLEYQRGNVEAAIWM